MKRTRNFFYKKINGVICLLLAFGLLFVCIATATNVILKKQYPLKYKPYVFKYCEEYALNYNLVFAVIKTESNFNKDAVSEKGAIGLMQITPATGDFIAKSLSLTDYNLFLPETNIMFGCFYLNYLFKKFENRNTVILAYNAGEGKVSQWLKNSEFSSNGKTLQKIPYAESDKYLVKVQKSFNIYAKLYGKILDNSKIIE